MHHARWAADRLPITGWQPGPPAAHHANDLVPLPARHPSRRWRLLIRHWQQPMCYTKFSVSELLLVWTPISHFAYANFLLIEKLNSRARELFSRLERFETRLHPDNAHFVCIYISDNSSNICMTEHVDDWTWGLHAGSTVEFHQDEINSLRSFVSCYKFCSQKLQCWDEIILTIKRGFCCNTALLFYGTVLKFLKALTF